MSNQRGMIDQFALFLVTAILAFLIWQVYPQGQGAPAETSGVAPSGQSEQTVAPQPPPGGEVDIGGVSPGEYSGK